MSGRADALGSNTPLMTDVQAYIENDGWIWCGTGGGSANAHTFTPSPVLTAYTTQQKFVGILGATNTASATVNINSLGAKTFKHSDGSQNLSGHELQSGNLISFIYDGTNMRLIGNQCGPVTHAPTHTGFSANPTVVANFAIQGRKVTYCYNTTANGTSNATGYTISLPVTAATIAGMVWYSVGLGTNNGVLENNIVATVASAGTTISLQRAAGATWTNSGAKGAGFVIEYFI